MVGTAVSVNSFTVNIVFSTANTGAEVNSTFARLSRYERFARNISQNMLRYRSDLQIIECEDPRLLTTMRSE